MVCILGTHWGHVLGTQLRQFYRGPLYICGRDPVRTRRIAGVLGAEPLPGWEAAVEHVGISALILALPPLLHYEVALAALRAGKDVLVEKPMALRVEDCDDMTEAAIEADAVLAVAENVPFRPAILKAKRLLPRIGQPRLLVATALYAPSNQTATGILFDYAVHYVRAVRCLFGEPLTVYALGGAEDHALLLFDGDGGEASLSLSWKASAGRCPEFVITGDQGSLKIWPENRAVDLYPVAPSLLTRAVSRIRPWSLRERLESPELQRQRFRVPVSDAMGYRAELEDFIRAVELNRGESDGPNGRLQKVASAIEGRRDLEVVTAAYESLVHQRPVRIKNTCSWEKPLPSSGRPGLES